MPELRLEIPGIPPTGNHYKNCRIIVPKSGAKPFLQWYLTDEAEAWYQTVQVIVAGRQLRAEGYSVSYLVYVPDRRRRDSDNWDKCVFDSLTKAGAIHDDSAVNERHAYKRIDRQNPRTVIVISTVQEQMFGERA